MVGLISKKIQLQKNVPYKNLKKAFGFDLLKKIPTSGDA